MLHAYLTLCYAIIILAIEPRIHARRAWKFSRNDSLSRHLPLCDYKTDLRNYDGKGLREFDLPSSHETTDDTILLRVANYTYIIVLREQYLHVSNNVTVEE